MYNIINGRVGIEKILNYLNFKVFFIGGAILNINDFKLVNLYSKKYFEYIKLSNKNKEISDINKKRLGFYLLILEAVTGNSDTDELQNAIIDKDYCNIVNEIENDDYGVDAVYIDEDNKKILLFNFKYRETFNKTTGGKEAPLLSSTKFLTTLKNNNFNKVTKLTKEKMLEINDKLKSDEIWDIILYLVSNENMSMSEDNQLMNSFKENFGMNIKTINLEDIVNYISERPEGISCSFLADSDSVLTYEENSLSSSKSYLVKLSIATLIRMTANNDELRNKHNLEAFNELKASKLNTNILYDNVRGYLGDSKFNKNIIKTLKENPNRFFMYNNGITITAKDVNSLSINGNKKFLFTIKDMQVVNGGQTLRSIYQFKNEDFDEEKLADASILVRIFKTENNSDLTNDIAEYTNSQNSISASDLKSINNLQIKIENYLGQYKIDYVRKSGDVELKNAGFKRITKEKTAQILYSYNGFPDRATNQKSKLFEKYYDEIFDENNLDFELLYKLIDLYFKIEQKYDSLSYEVFPQKIFYIIYLYKYNQDITYTINIVENSLKEYRKNENISDARKLIQKGFKDKLDEIFNPK